MYGREADLACWNMRNFWKYSLNVNGKREPMEITNSRVSLADGYTCDRGCLEILRVIKLSVTRNISVFCVEIR